MKHFSVSVTPSERELIDWMIDPMEDFWTTNEEGTAIDRPLYRSGPLAFVAQHRGVVADIQYRLMTQLSDMEECHLDPREQKNERRRASNLWKKIAQAATRAGIEV